MTAAPHSQSTPPLWLHVLGDTEGTRAHTKPVDASQSIGLSWGKAEGNERSGKDRKEERETLMT